MSLKSSDTGSHHVRGGFRNPWGEPLDHGFKDFLRWRRERKNSDLPSYDSARNSLPVEEPDLKRLQHPGDSLVITWLGHATLLVQMDGVNILTDPVFSERCSPVSFMGPRRITRFPMDPSQLPPIDIVVISHNHYDHLDKATVRLLGNRPVWFVPLGLKKWFARQGITNVREMDWWESDIVSNKTSVVCTPSRHFSSRTPWDRDQTLWSSWAILTPHYRIWFGGDTGYSKVFKQIGTRYGPFDLALIPIGAYKPEWFMNPVHLNPEQAVQVHFDLGARSSIGMHWGTFILTDEPVMEPPELVRQYAEKRGLNSDDFRLLTHGETLILP